MVPMKQQTTQPKAVEVFKHLSDLVCTLNLTLFSLKYFINKHHHLVVYQIAGYYYKKKVGMVSFSMKLRTVHVQDVFSVY